MADVEADECNGEAVDLSNRGLRIAAIFIIMFASGLGAVLPIILNRQSRMHVPKLTFFICKYVGTGVIIATAWMHLLAPAAEQLGDPCLEGRLGEYDWAFAIGLMTVIVMFFIEMLVNRYNPDAEDGKHSHSGSDVESAIDDSALKRNQQSVQAVSEPCDHAGPERQGILPDQTRIPGRPDDVSYPPGGADHMAHGRDHKEGDAYSSMVGQLTALLILEFGVVFHSIFIGLTLGTTDELVILLIVLVFHQMFEGLGLGARLAEASWSPNRRWVPYLFAAGFAISTPVGIAIGVAASPKNANNQKLANGVFDAISAGILMYTGLVELLAHEFMFNPHMRKASLKTLLSAFACVGFGAFIMALLAKWA